MLESLFNYVNGATAWVLCLDNETKTYLQKLNHKSIKSIALSEVEDAYPELLIAKEDRSLAEYYFTLSPFLPAFILSKTPKLQSIIYLDSDLEFFSSPIKIIEELKGKSIGIIEHRFHSSYDHSRFAGRFNVGWIFFHNDSESQRCLSQWMSQCAAWCKDHPEDGKFADQMYLNEWPQNFQKVKILEHPGANLAPWNLNSHELLLNENTFLSDSQNVIFYHFHMLRHVNENYVYTALDIYKVPTEVRREIVRWVYMPHLQKLKKMESKIRNEGFSFQCFKSNRDYSNVKKNITENQDLEQAIADGLMISFKN